MFELVFAMATRKSDRDASGEAILRAHDQFGLFARETAGAWVFETKPD